MFDSDFMPPMPLAFFQFAFALFIDILWAAAISYGASMVAQQFGKKPKQRLPDLGGYPIQTSQKGIAIPKVYGCERVAGNVIWMGEQNSYEKKTHQPGVDGHVRIKTYYKDFLIGIAEGSGSITKIWNGKDLIWAADGSGTNMNNDTQTITVGPAPTTDPGSVDAPGTILVSSGDGTQDARFHTGEDFGKYDDLIWAFFDNFETGPTPNVPNFSFEISTSSGQWVTTFISNNVSSDVLDADLAISENVASGPNTQTVDINPSSREVAFGSGTSIYRRQSDGTLDNTHYVPDGGWPVGTDIIRGVRYTHDGSYLYAMINSKTYGSSSTEIFKFEVSTGDEVWNQGWSGASWGLAVDSDDKVYAAVSGVGLRQVLADGTVGLDYASRWNNSRDIWADGADDLLFACGKDGESNLPLWTSKIEAYGLTGSTFQWAVTQIPGTITAGEILSIKTKDSVIYCCGGRNAIKPPGLVDASVWKLDIDGNIIDSYDTGGGCSYLWFDYLGRLVVKSDATDDKLWIFDPDDLTLLTSVDYNVVAGTGGSGAEGINMPLSINSDSCGDVNPAFMINDLATQDRYGAGIDSQYINAASVAEETAYWAAQSNEISLALTEQLPFMDWVDFVLSHCNGFRFWSEGKFHIGAFKDEASIVSLDQDDLVRDEGDDPPPPVQIVKRKASETTNRVEVSWVDRSNTYDAAVAMSKDDVDQRVSGKVRINPIDLRGIHNATLAEKQAYRLLFEGMYRFTIYSFDVSYKNMLYTVGDVITLSDGGLVTNQRMRIIAREEDKDGRMIHIEAVEDTSELYPEIAYNTQPTLAVPDVPVGSDDLVTGTLSFREHVTQSRLYMFFAPGDSDTDGALVYRSYDNITYLFIGRLAFDKDSLPNSAGTTTSALPLAEQVIHRYDESFTVDIGTITSLRTDVSDEELFAQQSMCKVGDEIIGFKTAEDQGSGIWHVSNLIRGMFGTGGNAHAIGATFATVSLIDIAYALDTEESGQTVYWKALATTGPTVSQTLADVTATAYTVVRESERPYPMSLVRVRDNVFGEVSAYPVIVDFNLPSKTMGYNLGGFGEGGWGEFVKDERITGVLVTLKTLAGVEISQAIYSLDGYHADNYDLTLLEVDRAGNDPVDVILQPVTSLASVKESNVIVDIV